MPYDRSQLLRFPSPPRTTGTRQRAPPATFKIGVCYYEARNFGKCFKLMRDVIEKYPVSPEVNQAYFYLGVGHFQQGHYSRAIAALERVGTALSGDGKQGRETFEAGKAASTSASMTPTWPRWSWARQSRSMSR